MSNKEAEFDCPICNKGVMIGYYIHKGCWEELNKDLKNLFNKLEGIKIPYNIIRNVLEPFYKKYLGEM